MKMTTDKARFETENGVRLKQTKIYTSTIAKCDQLDSEDEEDEDDQFPIQMNAEIENIQKQVRDKVSEIKKGLHVIGKMPIGMISAMKIGLKHIFSRGRSVVQLCWGRDKNFARL